MRNEDIQDRDKPKYNKVRKGLEKKSKNKLIAYTELDKYVSEYMDIIGNLKLSLIR